MSTLVLCAVLAACSGGDGGGGGPVDPQPQPPQPKPPASVQASGGDAQSARLGGALAKELTVVVRDASGSPVANTSVQWAVTSGGGTLSSATTQTDATGTARTNWTLGNQRGAQSASATVAGLQPVQFNASAVAFYTYMVYMAADNDLSWAGVDDIDEMETIGSSDSVNVVVQAEFSPHHTRLKGCTSTCFNRPNYNTFRYRAVRGGTRRGPDGVVEDVGNRNMTDPADLADFIRWAKQNHPAEHYVLVLWNHGGGYQGLLQDETSAGSSLMSVASLRTALQSAATPLALVNFDMCLMGGAETLLTIQGLTDYVAFSEEVEPGEGDPYDRILGRLRANPAMSPRELSQTITDEFVASYRGSRNSVTKSAADMSRLAPFVTAWEALSGELRTNIAAHGPALAQVVGGVQAYEYPYLRDLGDFLTRLRAASGSAQLHGRIDALRTELSAIVVRNGFHTSNSYGAANVNGSTGLSVLLPSGGSRDAMPSTGPGSYSSYKALYPSSGWTAFLDQWLASAKQANYFDQGANQMQAALVWDSAAVSRGADLDLWVVEPNGDIYIPYLGVVTPNGTFSDDSETTATYFETYATRRHVERGVYYFFAELYADPQNYQPAYTFLYRMSSGAEWVDLYKAPYPRLSLAVSWGDDATPTLQEAIDGKYTDLRMVAKWDLRASAQSAAAGGASYSRSGAMPAAPGLARASASSPRPRVTAAQERKLAELLRDPRVRARRNTLRAERTRTGDIRPDLAGAAARLRAGAPR